MVLENRHTGERLALRRVERGDEVWLELKGSQKWSRFSEQLR